MRKYENVNINKLKPYENNARTHSEEQINKIVRSIDAFGFINPVLIDGEFGIIAGHGRVMAAKKMGMNEVPCLFVEDLTEAQKRAYIIADNKLALDAGWDETILKIELAELQEMDFDITLTGFEMEDIELDDYSSGVEEDDYDVEPPAEPKAKFGQIYQLGRHRLMCGDSTDKSMVEKLMDGAKADLYLTDPPYNVDYVGKGEEALTIQNDHFDTDEECGEKLWLPTFENARASAKSCCSVYCFMPQGGTHMMMMMMMMRAGWKVKHELIWKKQSIVLNRADYNYQHEPFLYGWNETHKFYGNGKYKNTSVWEFDRPTKSKEHPTMKPIELFGEILLNATKTDDVVLDTFGGSGTSIMACEQLDRNCYMMELDPKYIDVIIDRWEQYTGEKAVLLNG